MSLEFRVVCALFERLQQSYPGNQLTRDAIVRTWFREHDSNLPRRGTGGIALLSCVFPEWRPDRVFGLREKRLERIVVKALGLGVGRVYELLRLQDQDGLDFASAVQQIISATDGTQQPRRQCVITSNLRLTYKILLFSAGARNPRKGLLIASRACDYIDKRRG
jgi:DNA ligase N terminus